MANSSRKEAPYQTFTAHPYLPDVRNQIDARFSQVPVSKNSALQTTKSRKQRNRTPCLFCKESRTQCTLLISGGREICSRCDAKQITPEMCSLRDPLEHIVQVYLEKIRRDKLISPDLGTHYETYLDESCNHIQLQQMGGMSSIPMIQTVHHPRSDHGQYLAGQLFTESFDCPEMIELSSAVSPINSDSLGKQSFGYSNVQSNYPFPHDYSQTPTRDRLV